MNFQKLFDYKASIYDLYQPTYTPCAIEFLYLSGIIKPDDIVADIGAGTGILTKNIVDYGNKVIAIEPNEQRRR